MKATDIEQAHAHAQARAEAEQIDGSTLRSVAAWLRILAKHYPPRRARRLETTAQIVEQHNERVAVRADKRRWSERRARR
jgi:hypothetical protein